MPVYLRALVVILVLATVIFAFAKAPACALACAPADFERRRNLWFGITLAVFLAHNFYIYIFAAAALLLTALPKEQNRLAMYFSLLFAAPALPSELPGFGVINHFFVIDYPRLLSLTVLLPTALSLRKQAGSMPFGRLATDKLIAGYIALNFFLAASYSDNLTNTVRTGLFYVIIDIFLPYYVASRALKDLNDFRDALMAFVIGVMILSAVATFEYGKSWLLYENLEPVLGVKSTGFGSFLARGESLRANGSAGQPVVLGCIVIAALGFYLYLKKMILKPLTWRLGLLVLLAGLLAPVSRGPWIGAIAGLLVFVALGPAPMMGLAKLGLICAIVVPAVLVSPAGEKIIDLIPFVGTVEPQNAEYRQRFLEVGIEVMKQSPFFGNYYFGKLREFDELRPQGLLDTLNVFLTVALETGGVGLFFFAGVAVAAAVGIFIGMQRTIDRNDEGYLLGRALLSTMVAIIVIMNTISNILLIPTIYWLVCGIGAAYARLPAPASSSSKTPAVAGRAGFQRASMKSRS